MFDRLQYRTICKTKAYKRLLMVLEEDITPKNPEKYIQAIMLEHGTAHTPRKAVECVVYNLIG